MKMARLIIDNNEYTDEYYQDCFETALTEAEKEYGLIFGRDVSFTSDDIEAAFFEQVDYDSEELEKDVYEATIEDYLVTTNDTNFVLTYILRHLPEDDKYHWYFDNESLKIVKK